MRTQQVTGIRRRAAGDAGLTAIEMLIAVGVMATVLTFTLAAFSGTLRTFGDTVRRTENQTQVMTVLQQMTKSLRQAQRPVPGDATSSAFAAVSATSVEFWTLQDASGKSPAYVKYELTTPSGGIASLTAKVWSPELIASRSDWNVQPPSSLRTLGTNVLASGYDVFTFLVRQSDGSMAALDPSTYASGLARASIDAVQIRLKVRATTYAADAPTEAENTVRLPNLDGSGFGQVVQTTPTTQPVTTTTTTTPPSTTTTQPQGTTTTQPRTNTGYWMTFVARECDDYTDVTGNRARNNIMESLRDLGQDTLYGESWNLSPKPIRPAMEDLAPQTRCRPLSGFKFSTGTGLRARAVDQLSIVTGYMNTYQTQPYTEEYDQNLNPVKDASGNVKMIPGAVTVELTAAEVKCLLAQTGCTSRLWVQQGTTTDPLNKADYPKQKYGFASLRCATDDLNGDNVEFVGLPSSTAKHVFCYAYDVVNAPGNGTIVVKVVNKGVGAKTFNFGGNVSYNPGGVFSMTANDGGGSASTSFIRAAVAPGTAPWVVTETLTDPYWRLFNLSCASANATSTAVIDAVAKKATITLGESDTMTCTFTNDRALGPPS